MTGCCKSPDCRRQQPMRLGRGMDGWWYVVTSYDERTRETLTRHALPKDVSDALEDMRKAYGWLETVKKRFRSMRKIEQALGIEIVRIDTHDKGSG